MALCYPLRRLFSCQYMLKPQEIRGTIPTTREAYRAVLAVAWPSIVESLLVSLMSSIDTMMVGSIGPYAITAVGICNQPRFIILAMIFSLNVGITAVVSRRKGQGDYEGANRCLKQCVLLSFGISAVLAAFGALFSMQLVAFAGAEPDVVPVAGSYFRITMVGIVFVALNLTINAAQRGVSNTRISMITNLVANVVNVIFNYLLINGIGPFPELGVDGAAIATVLGNVTAFLLALRSVWKPAHANSFLDITCAASWRFDRKTLQSLFQVASSAMVEQVFMRVGFFLYAWMVAKLGTNAFATHQICMQILNLSFSAGDGFSIAASALMGQNLGKKRPDLSKLYVSTIQRCALVVSTLIALLFLFGRSFLMGLFTTDPTIIRDGAVLMIIMACTTHLQTSQVVVSGSLRGAGDTRYVAAVSFLSIGILRPVLTWLFCFPLGLGLVGAWMTLFLDQTMRFVANFARFLSGKWMKIDL